MNLFIRAAITAAACATIAGATAGAAAAAESPRTDSVVEINSVPSHFVGNDEDVAAFRCPLDHPYLYNQAYTSTMSINGVQVVSSTNDGVAIEQPMLNPNGDHSVVGYGVGIAGGPQIVSVNAYCTSDPTQGYRA